jgi:hypothetical protein
MNDYAIDEQQIKWAEKQTWCIMDLSGAPKHIRDDILQCKHKWVYGLTGHFNIWSACKSCGVEREMLSTPPSEVTRDLWR